MNCSCCTSTSSRTSRFKSCWQVHMCSACSGCPFNLLWTVDQRLGDVQAADMAIMTFHQSQEAAEAQHYLTALGQLLRPCHAEDDPNTPVTSLTPLTCLLRVITVGKWYHQWRAPAWSQCGIFGAKLSRTCEQQQVVPGGMSDNKTHRIRDSLVRGSCFIDDL
jgi:hypothetical protein